MTPLSSKCVIYMRPNDVMEIRSLSRVTYVGYHNSAVDVCEIRRLAFKGYKPSRQSTECLVPVNGVLALTLVGGCATRYISISLYRIHG